MATVVRKKPGESDDKVVVRFRKRVVEDKVLIEYKDRRYYKSPAEIKKEKRKASARRKRRPRR